MKNLTELLTPEQKKKLENCYIIDDEYALREIISNGELTIENFNIITITTKGFMIARAEDICYYSPNNNDFDFGVGEMYFFRSKTPNDVVAMLDKYLGKDKYEK